MTDKPSKEYIQGHEDGYKLGIKHGRGQVLDQLHRIEDEISKVIKKKVEEINKNGERHEDGF